MTQQSGSKSNQFNTSSSASQTGQSSGSSTVSDVADQAKETAGQIADQARQQATSRIADQKDRAAEGLTGVAQALRQTSQQLNDHDQSGFTTYIDSAANQVERVSHYLRDKDVGELIDDVEYYARREPALFVGGAFVLGLLGARFLKSSRPQASGSGSYALATRRNYAPTRGSYYGQGQQRAGGSLSRYGATSSTANYGYSTADADASRTTGTTGTTGTHGTNVAGTETSGTAARAVGSGTTTSTSRTGATGATGTTGSTGTTGTTGNTGSTGTTGTGTTSNTERRRNTEE
ncbi:MAG TPA: hypothetical protein VFT66_08820 [Roseiflexaceae bacterium]|nr:hypothetical protein [Roseiflexaceae bacterium]